MNRYNDFVCVRNIRLFQNTGKMRQILETESLLKIMTYIAL